MMWNYRIIKDITSDTPIFSVKMVQYDEDEETILQIFENPLILGNEKSLDELLWSCGAVEGVEKKPIIVLKNGIVIEEINQINNNKN